MREGVNDEVARVDNDDRELPEGGYEKFLTAFNRAKTNTALAQS